MKTELLQELRDIISVQHTGPALSFFIPVKPYMQSSEEIGYSLRIALKNAKSALHNKYINEQFQNVVDKAKKNVFRHSNTSRYRLSYDVCFR